MVTAAQRDRVASYIEMGVKEGAKLVVDGRGFKLQDYENSFYMGDSPFDYVKPTMQSHKDKIFGPELQIAGAKDFDEEISLPAEHQYGNGVAIFTCDGNSAREFAVRVQVGMVGVNIHPRSACVHTFGGWKRPAFGDVHVHGPEGVCFHTKVKTVTARRLKGSVRENPDFKIPTMNWEYAQPFGG